LFECKNKLFLIQKINELENGRVYNEFEITPVQAFYSELGLYFNQCIREGYNIYVFNNKPIHEIKFSNEDIGYISTDPHKHREELFDYYFSENIKYIKKNQLKDYEWLLCENKFDFLISIPNLDENNKYYYNFIIGTKDANKISNLINHEFNLIKLDSIQYLNQILFDIEFLEKLFKIKNIENLDNVTTIFKNKDFTYYEINLWKDNDGKYFPFDKYIKACLEKISFHFYYDNSINKVYAYTNFLELANGVAIQNTEESFKIDSALYPMSFTDIIGYDELLFFVQWEIKKFHWTIVDWEKDYLSFLSYQIKNFNWNEPNQQLLCWKKLTLEKYKMRLKEYRKLLKNLKKK